MYIKKHYFNFNVDIIIQKDKENNSINVPYIKSVVDGSHVFPTKLDKPAENVFILKKINHKRI